MPFCLDPPSLMYISDGVNVLDELDEWGLPVSFASLEWGETIERRFFYGRHVSEAARWIRDAYERNALTEEKHGALQDWVLPDMETTADIEDDAAFNGWSLVKREWWERWMLNAYTASLANGFDYGMTAEEFVEGLLINWGQQNSYFANRGKWQLASQTYFFPFRLLSLIGLQPGLPYQIQTGFLSIDESWDALNAVADNSGPSGAATYHMGHGAGLQRAKYSDEDGPPLETMNLRFTVHAARTNGANTLRQQYGFWADGASPTLRTRGLWNPDLPLRDVPFQVAFVWVSVEEWSAADDSGGSQLWRAFPLDAVRRAVPFAVLTEEDQDFDLEAIMDIEPPGENNWACFIIMPTWGSVIEMDDPVFPTVDEHMEAITELRCDSVGDRLHYYSAGDGGSDYTLGRIGVDALMMTG